MKAVIPPPPLERGHSPPSQQCSSKNWDTVKPPFWKFGRRFNSPQQKKGSTHYGLGEGVSFPLKAVKGVEHSVRSKELYYQ